MYDVEIFRCKGIANISEYLHTMTRALESQLERPLTAFNCVSKATKLKVGDELTGQQKENFMVRTLRLLAVVAGALFLIVLFSPWRPVSHRHRR
jgi:hypothetical protein